jgi:lysozyme
LIVRAFKPKEIIDLLERHEGYIAKPYQDSLGNWTFGIGATYITRKQARNLAWDQCVDDFMPDLDRDLPWWRGLSKARQLVLLDMCFNLGINRLLTFRNALAAMQAERWDDAAREMLDSRWARQVGNRSEELADIMREG